jgi:flagellar hook protein FlgE
MNDPFISALNSQKACQSWFETIAYNLGNMYTPGFKQSQTTFAEYVNGVTTSTIPWNMDQGKAIPGQGPTNLMIEGKSFFVVRKEDASLRFTRLGDFKFNAEGTLVNEAGDKVQGYLLNEAGEVMNTGDAEMAASAPGQTPPGPNNPSHAAGGPGHLPTTEINLWVDPSNGKFFGKYDEYKIKGNGTVVGIANKGKVEDPLYKVALVSFVNPQGLAQPEDNMYVQTALSGEPVEGEGEVRSGVLEKSNVDTREQVSYLQQAKLQMEVSAKLISTNKSLLEEALRLIQ